MQCQVNVRAKRATLVIPRCVAALRSRALNPKDPRHSTRMGRHITFRQVSGRQCVREYVRLCVMSCRRPRYAQRTPRSVDCRRALTVAQQMLANASKCPSSARCFPLAGWWRGVVALVARPALAHGARTRLALLLDGICTYSPSRPTSVWIDVSTLPKKTEHWLHWYTGKTGGGETRCLQFRAFNVHNLSKCFKAQASSCAEDMKKWHEKVLVQAHLGNLRCLNRRLRLASTSREAGRRLKLCARGKARVVLFYASASRAGE